MQPAAIESQTPPCSQENLAPSSSSLDYALGNAPPKSLDQSHDERIKPKKPPTVTPRSFTRFFTPRTSVEKGSRIGASRRALRDITALGANRSKENTSTREHWRTCVDEEDDQPHAKRRKLQTPLSPATTPDNSSPLKGVTAQSFARHDVTAASADLLYSESDEEEIRNPPRSNSCFEPMQKSRYRQQLGFQLRREVGRQFSSFQEDEHIGRFDWQSETSNFYTQPKDSHQCMEFANRSARTVPFCTAACNTNSLVAIGDEDGGVRLLESSPNQKPPFGRPWVSFQAHTNAVLDMCFSPDDLLLATASGDQTSRIIDVRTRRVLHAMSGHDSSIKQVRFQPGSSNVLATSSRDGSIRVWDLRCRSLDAPIQKIRVPLDPKLDSRISTSKKMTWTRSVNVIPGAHVHRRAALVQSPAPPDGAISQAVFTSDAPSRSEASGRTGDVSVTALAFLPDSRSHLLATASEANASVKLWDLRTTYQSRRSSRMATPLSTTQQPESHSKSRQFGLTSLALSGNGSTLYTLCRDSTVYAYPTSHLILGQAADSSGLGSVKNKRATSHMTDQNGVGPIYGLRHPRFHASSFYISSSLRPSKDDRSEILAVGSSDGAAILFPTDDRLLSQYEARPRLQTEPARTTSRRPPLSRTNSGITSRLDDSFPIYDSGTALVRGHKREVGALTWTFGGQLVTLGDDCKVRLWHEDDKSTARCLRAAGEGGGKRWGCGWAEVTDDWDDVDC